MVPFIHFLSDMLAKKPTKEQAKAQAKFAQDPDGLMASYGLDKDQAAAIKSGNTLRIGDLARQNLADVPRSKGNPDW